MSKHVVRAIGLGFFTTSFVLLALGGLYIVRLYATGFPEQDVAFDVRDYVYRVVPLSVICGLILFLAYLNTSGESIGELSMFVAVITGPTALALFVVDLLDVELSVAAFFRLAAGCAAAIASHVFVLACRKLL